MPLVTRTANQGIFFKQTTEPGGWLNGDLWSDTTANVLKLNVTGTAEEIGGLDIADVNARTTVATSSSVDVQPAAGVIHNQTIRMDDVEALAHKDMFAFLFDGTNESLNESETSVALDTDAPGHANIGVMAYNNVMFLRMSNRDGVETHIFMRTGYSLT